MAAPTRANVLLETVAPDAHQGASLLALGTDLRSAIRTALSPKGYWHLARSLATQIGMTNEWLRGQGLLSIRALWMKAQGYV